MSQPITIYHKATGKPLVMYAPTTANEYLAGGEYSREAPTDDELMGAAATGEHSGGSKDKAGKVKYTVKMSDADLLAAARAMGTEPNPQWTKEQLVAVLNTPK